MCVVEECVGTDKVGRGGEETRGGLDGITTPPLSKKIAKRTIFAPDGRVGELRVGLLVAAATPMSQGRIVDLVITAVLDLTVTQIESAANVKLLHVRGRHAIGFIGHLFTVVAARISAGGLPAGAE